MPNVASVLREEIVRLARKEIKSETAVFRRASAQYRRDIAQLKRELQGANRRVALLEQTVKKLRRDPSSQVDTDGKRFAPRSVKAHRERLGLSAADYGKLVGVSGNTVYLWEQGKARPRPKAFAAIVALRSLGKRAAHARLANGHA